MTDDACSLHGVEPLPTGCYRVCVECGHAFTAREILDLHNAHVALREEIEQRERDYLPSWDDDGNWLGPPPPAVPKDPVTDPDLIRVCPLCAHDF